MGQLALPAFPGRQAGRKYRTDQISFGKIRRSHVNDKTVHELVAKESFR
jgi:hypothetical protein